VTAPQTQPQHPAEPAAPADGDGALEAVAALLVTGGAVGLLAAAIWALLHRRRRAVTRSAVAAAVRLTDRSTAHRPRMVGRADVARGQRDLEARYRAAYIIRAAERLTAAAPAGDDGDSDPKALLAALGRERAYLLAHARARRARMQAAAAVDAAASEWGPLLGWHTVLDGHATPECRAADGSNFRVTDPPVIGWPGTLHGGACRCYAGKPFPGGTMTNAAVAPLLSRGRRIA
jgi:hypothetical protein